MLKNDVVRVRHILDAAQEAVAFASGRSREELETDRMFNLSLVRLLEIIGEGAKEISEELRQAHPKTAWKEMAGMRDRLIHAYFDINLDVVWETVNKDLPPLIAQLMAIMASENKI